jgi:hypothetical protein
MYMSSSSTYGLQGPRGAELLLLLLGLRVALSMSPIDVQQPVVEDGDGEPCDSSSAIFKSLNKLISERMSDACFSEDCVIRYMIVCFCCGADDKIDRV